MLMASIVFLAAFVLYVRTLAPGLPWGDAGELIAAAHSLGLAHPPGSPLYLLLAKLATLVPIGTIPFRVGLLSAVSAAGLVAVLYLLLRDLLRMAADAAGERRIPRALLIEVPAAGAALVFAATPTLWSYAVYSKGYTVHLLLVALIVASGLRWLRTDDPRALRMAWLIAGLALAVHPATLFLLPGLGYLLWTGRRRGMDRPAILRTILLVLPGLALHLYVPIRALADPSFAWGFPTTLRDIVAYLIAAQFRFEGGPLGWASARAMLTGPVRHLAWPAQEFTAVLIPVIALGLARCWRRHRPAAIFTLLVAGATYLVPITGAAFDISRDGPAYYLPLYAVMAIWLGLGLQWLLARAVVAAEPASRPSAWRAALAGGLVVGALPVLIGLHAYPAAQVRRTEIPERLARFLLAEVKPVAVLVAEDPDVLFPLWYAQHVERVRPDVAVIPVPWLGLYPRQLARRYPDLVFPQDPGVGRVEAFLLANAGRRPLYIVGPTEGLGAAEARLVPRGVLFELRDGAADPADHRQALARFESHVLGGGEAPLDRGTAFWISRLYGEIGRSLARRGWPDEAIRLTARATTFPGPLQADSNLPVITAQGGSGTGPYGNPTPTPTPTPTPPALPIPSPPPLPPTLPPIDTSQAIPQVRNVQITVFSTNGTVPGTDRTVRNEIIDLAERVTGQRGFQLNQDQATGVANLNIPGGVNLSFLPITFRSPGAALRRQDTATQVECGASGTARVTTATGAQIEAMGIPPDLRAFVTLMQQFDAQARVQIIPGQLIVDTPNNQTFTQLSLRTGFALSPGAGAARFDMQAGLITYLINNQPTSQAATATFADCGAFLEAARQFPGVTQAVPLGDGLIQVSAGATTLRVKPDFTVTRSGGNTKRILVEGGTPAFDTGDGRRQRFTIVP